MDRRALLAWLDQDKKSLDALGENDTDAFLHYIRQQFPATVNFESALFYRTVKSWIAQAGCPGNLARAAKKCKDKQTKVGNKRRHFIYQAGLNVSDGDREKTLESIPVRRVEALAAPYPPFKFIISESPDIHAKWFDHFDSGYQADDRIPRLPIHELDPSNLVLDIPPNESIRLETPSGELVGLVMRNFCPSDKATAWADAAAEKQVPYRRNVRVCIDIFSLTYLLIMRRRRIRERWCSWAGRLASVANAHFIGYETSPIGASKATRPPN